VASESELGRAKRALFSSLRLEIRDERVLQAMEQVPRELFVPLTSRHLAYEDIPLPIDSGQTISQPFIVALMTSALGLSESDRVLEIGTGSGYQAAILSKLVSKGSVLTLERIPNLADTARAFLYALRCPNVSVKLAGTTLGAREEAPFDAILVTAGAPRLPQTLLDQLAPGGRLVAPVGSLREQELVKATRTDEGFSYKMLGPCRFVPLIGEGAWSEGELGLL